MMVASWQGKAVGGNRRLLWSPRAKRMVPNPGYIRFKKSIAAEFELHQNHFDNDVYVYLRLWLHPKADPDNLIKPVLDALELAGTLNNDNQVAALAFNHKHKKQKELDRIIVVVEEWHDEGE